MYLIYNKYNLIYSLATILHSSLLKREYYSVIKSDGWEISSVEQSDLVLLKLVVVQILALYEVLPGYKIVWDPSVGCQPHLYGFLDLG